MSDRCIEGKNCKNWLDKCKHCIRNEFIKQKDKLFDFAEYEDDYSVFDDNWSDDPELGCKG